MINKSTYCDIFITLGSLQIPAIYNAPLCKPAGEDQLLPCVIFSHGLGGNRLIYNTYCCELASQGCLVACVEHRLAVMALFSFLSMGLSILAKNCLFRKMFCHHQHKCEWFVMT